MDTSHAAQAHGFRMVSQEPLHEINGFAHIMTHEISGAKLLFLENDDQDKAFSIAFRTPPADDTGVFHILEHSVLNGSAKFPVKEPFVNLLKTSMQTFLNAMTFPDKTMYPVASTNQQDLLNLMDVYLDAVFHPNIYRNPSIFQQEGWHYELEDDGGDSSTEGQLRWNGVVYNEMKGALSDAESVLYDTLQQRLFPSTCYRFEAGGTPEAIPTLSYEQFLNEHAQHYRTDNSFIVIYGNVDIDRMLSFLDEQYLTPVAHEQRKADSLRAHPLTPRKLTVQEPVSTPYFAKRMVTSPENACMAQGFVIGHASDRMKIAATDILLDAIMGSNEAPLKRALLDANLAADANAYVADALLQPFAVVELRGVEEQKSTEFRNVMQTCIESLANGELDPNLLEASLSRAEFVMREGVFGMSDGVAYAMASLSGWLYDDSLATAYLRYEEEFRFMRDHLYDGWFNQLLREIFLENDHTALVEVIPLQNDEEDAEEKRLAKIAERLTPADKNRIQDDMAKLRAMQETPDSPESLATLPSLRVSDIEDVPEEPQYQEVTLNGILLIHHSVETNGICYAHRYFDLSCVAFEDMPYVSLLADLLGKMDTASHSAQELDVLINGKLGNLTIRPVVHEIPDDPKASRPLLTVSASCLPTKADYLAALSHEILTETDFSNTGKILDVLKQRKAVMENAFINSGHTAASARLASYYLPAGVLSDTLSGIGCYQFTKQLVGNFDAYAASLPQKLESLARLIFTDGNQLLSYAGPHSSFETFKMTGALLGNSQSKPKSVLSIPQPEIRNEAFVVPTDICFAAAGWDHRMIDANYHASWTVAARALNFDYLWNEVRVKGGAYGVGFQTGRTGTLRFYSFRDPRLDRTLECFENAGEWISEGTPSEAELEGYIVSTIASYDRPQKPRAIVKRQNDDFIAGRTWSDRMTARKQMIGTTPEDLKAMAKPLATALQEGAR